jgi:L-ascorbate metabolism protein UlaG (beta-lactamase superfamily)
VISMIVVKSISRDILLHHYPETLAFQWLGQAGFALRTADSFFLIDPYLSDSLNAKYRNTIYPHERLHEPPVPPEDLSAVDYVFSTHGHTDHLDQGTLPVIQQHNSSCRFVLPVAEKRKALQRGLQEERLILIDAGETRPLGQGLIVTAIPSAHEEIVKDEWGRDLYLGYLIRWKKLCIYHSGDCVPFVGLVEILREYRPSLFFLPINGRDTKRIENGIPGNFTPREAAELVLAVNDGILIGHHFGLFAFNTVSREEAQKIFCEYETKGLRWLLPNLQTSYAVIQSVEEQL